MARDIQHRKPFVWWPRSRACRSRGLSQCELGRSLCSEYMVETVEEKIHNLNKNVHKWSERYNWCPNRQNRYTNKFRFWSFKIVKLFSSLQNCCVIRYSPSKSIRYKEIASEAWESLLVIYDKDRSRDDIIGMRKKAWLTCWRNRKSQKETHSRRRKAQFCVGRNNSVFN